MDRYSCKLCFRNFANGKALGGHMRSHMMKLTLSQKKPVDNFQPSFSSSSEEDGGTEEVKGLVSSELETRTEFSCVATGSVVLQDRESETESSKNNPVRKRSKRVRKSDFSGSSINGFLDQVKRSNLGNGKGYEHSSSSSISDTTTEEDVAHCLMMLSKDTWASDYQKQKFGEEEDYSEDSGGEKVKKIKVRGKYRCETCYKLFRSYQALGGHRTSHKKTKQVPQPEMALEKKKIHECPFCHRVFASGQALGGHKRTHFIGVGGISANDVVPVKSISRIGDFFDIDLNLPAPVEDGYDEITQIEISAVSELL